MTRPTEALTRWRKRREWAIESLLFLAAVSSILITLGIVIVLFGESARFFEVVPLRNFLTDTRWTPQFAKPQYGILVLLSGTLVTTGIALAVALPAGTIIAAYLSEFASHRVREVIKPVLELLSAIPTVVFGYFALLFVSPLLKTVFPDLSTFNMLSAGLVMGIMIIPYVSSLSEDAMRAVPMLLREGSYGLGANRVITSFRVVFPAAFSGIVASYVLAVSRAIGETMIVAIAAGQRARLTWNPTDSAATVTSYIVQVSKGDLQHEAIGYKAIFAAGLTLFVMTFAFNMAGHWLRRRFREAY